jgi:hypothetical protein
MYRSGVVYEAMPTALFYKRYSSAIVFVLQHSLHTRDGYEQMGTDGSVKCRPRFFKNNLFRRLRRRSTYTRRHVFLLKPHRFHQRLYILRTHRGQNRLIVSDTAKALFRHGL